MCPNRFFSISLRSAWSLSDLPPRELEIEPGQKLDVETGFLWSELVPLGKQRTKPPVCQWSCREAERGSHAWAEEMLPREVFACGTRYRLVLSHVWEGPEPETAAGLVI